MWSRWKRKLQSLFITETSEPKTDNNKRTERNKGNESFETKMVYKYPDVTAFRFPVIPDQKNNKTAKDELPAYKRRDNKQTRELKRDRVNLTNELQNNKLTNEVSKQPFRPSEVASPIYGYKERKRDREIKDIPAYVRKKELEEKNYNVEMPTEEQMISTKTSDPIVDLNKDKHVHIIKKEQAQTQTQTQAQAEVVNTRNDKSRRSVHKETSHKKKRAPHRRQNTDINKVPYNVMMTPKDKQRLVSKTANNVPIVHNDNDLPPDYLLNDPIEQSSQDQLWVEDQKQLLEKTLTHFNIKAKVVRATQGPAVTRLEVQPAKGVKVSRIRNLSDDIKLNMAAKDIRIEAPIPGKNTIGIEVPNINSQVVGLQEIFTTKEFKQGTSPLTIGLGLTIEGRPLITDIGKMPHGLIAGATGSGKSVCINTILISLLYKSSFEDVKFLLIDPKMVELAPYNGIPHLVAPVITDVKAATASLKWAVEEMEDRYEKFVKEGVRDIEGHNDKMLKQNRLKEKIPFIVIVIDELADLMMMAPQDVEDSICRITQKARACGIHLLVATQRPSVDVVTGLIKANIPTRIAFSVSSQVDSRTIIDANGAEKLLGKGDMLFIENGSRNSLRLQGAFVSDEEIDRVTDYARSLSPPNYLFEQEQLIQQVATEEAEDDLLDDVIQFIIEQNSASTSLLQRQFRIGYNRAARLIDLLESRGLISEQNGSKPRDVLLSWPQYEEMLQEI